MSQIRMSTEIEERVGNLLSSSQDTVSAGTSSSTSGNSAKLSSKAVETAKPKLTIEDDTATKRLNVELKQKQEKTRVQFFLSILLVLHLIFRWYFLDSAVELFFNYSARKVKKSRQ